MTSHVAEPRAGLADLHLLPFSFFPEMGDPHIDPALAKTLTYQQQVDAGVLRVRRVGTSVLCVENDHMGQSLVEGARADFDGDGIEDLLVFEYCYATHGTLGFGGVRLLSRKTADGLFEVTGL